MFEGFTDRGGGFARPFRAAGKIDVREASETRVILVNLSGHGIFGVAACESFRDGKMA